MLQFLEWSTEGKFYIGIFVLLTFVEPVRLMPMQWIDTIQICLCKTRLYLPQCFSIINYIHHLHEVLISITLTLVIKILFYFIFIYFICFSGGSS